MAAEYPAAETDPVAEAGLTAHEADATAHSALFGAKQDALPGTVDTVNGRILLHPTSPGENAVVVKAPDAIWGDADQAYGTGQAFMLLREDYTDPPNGGVDQYPDKAVLYRVNGGDGAVGTAGNLHVATGLRQRAGYASGPDTGGGCIWINPYVDVAAISITPSVAFSSVYLRCYDINHVIVAALDHNGQMQLNTQGSTGGLTMGGDIALYRSSANAATLTGALTVQSASFAVQPSPAASTTAQVLSGDLTKFAGIQVGRLSGEGQLFVAPSTNFVFTGTIAGDTLVRALSATSVLHIGVASGAAEIRIGDSTIGFHGTAPIAKATVSGSRASNAALASLITALANKGLITDGSSA